MRWRGLLLAWAPALILMAVIFALSSRSSLPGLSDPTADLLFKKGVHAAGYGMLALFYLRGLHYHGVRKERLWAWALAVLYAISDEWHQTFVPGRDGNVVDIIIDGTGAALALLLEPYGRHLWSRWQVKFPFWSPQGLRSWLGSRSTEG